jgi:hypothetical protein
MRNEVTMSNYDNVTEDQSLCYVTGQKFTPQNGIIFTMDGRDVCPEIALKNGFKPSKEFRLPYTVNTRNKLGEYLEKIGVKRNENLSLYNRLYSELGNNLPAELTWSNKPAGHTNNLR